jgi:hypothetical protein
MFWWHWHEPAHKPVERYPVALGCPLDDVREFLGALIVTSGSGDTPTTAR